MKNESSPIYLFNTSINYNIFTNKSFNQYWKSENNKKVHKNLTFFNFYPLSNSKVDLIIYSLVGTSNKLNDNSSVDSFPTLLREHSLKFPLFPRIDLEGSSGFYDFNNEKYILENITFLDYGNIDLSDVDNKKRLDNLNIKNFKENKPFLTIGGDHAITYFNIKSIHDNTGKKPILIQFDAHQDLGVHEMNNSKLHQGNFVSHLIADDLITCVVQVGIRGIRSRNQLATSEKIITLSDMKYDTLNEEFINSIINKFNENDIYISVDFDVLNPTIFSYVDFPIPGGLTFEILNTLIQKIFKSEGNVIGVDMVEINSDGAESDYNLPIYFLTNLLYEFEKRMI